MKNIEEKGKFSRLDLLALLKLIFGLDQYLFDLINTSATGKSCQIDEISVLYYVETVSDR